MTLKAAHAATVKVPRLRSSRSVSSKPIIRFCSCIVAFQNKKFYNSCDHHRETLEDQWKKAQSKWFLRNAQGKYQKSRSKTLTRPRSDTRSAADTRSADQKRIRDARRERRGLLCGNRSTQGFPRPCEAVQSLVKPCVGLEKPCNFSDISGQGLAKPRKAVYARLCEALQSLESLEKPPNCVLLRKDASAKRNTICRQTKHTRKITKCFSCLAPENPRILCV